MIDKNIIKPELITMTEPDSIISEAYRALRTNVQFISTDRDIKVIVLTSPSPQEGKTSVAISLAVTICQSDKKVLLIDADLRNPSLHRNFELDNKTGLSDLLLKDEPLEKLVKSIAVKGLHILTSGPKALTPSELLGSEKMRNFAAVARAKYDFVIFDSPPLLPVTDAAILSKITDGVIIVVRSRRTVIDAIKRVKTILQNLKVNILGVVITDIDQKSEHYYYYDYKYKYAQDEKSRKR